MTLCGVVWIAPANRTVPKGRLVNPAVTALWASCQDGGPPQRVGSDWLVDRFLAPRPRRSIENEKRRPLKVLPNDCECQRRYDTNWSSSPRSISHKRNQTSSNTRKASSQSIHGRRATSPSYRRMAPPPADWSILSGAELN